MAHPKCSFSIFLTIQRVLVDSRNLFWSKGLIWNERGGIHEDICCLFAASRCLGNVSICIVKISLIHVHQKGRKKERKKERKNRQKFKKVQMDLFVNNSDYRTVQNAFTWLMVSNHYYKYIKKISLLKIKTSPGSRRTFDQISRQSYDLEQNRQQGRNFAFGPKPGKPVCLEVAPNPSHIALRGELVDNHWLVWSHSRKPN